MFFSGISDFESKFKTFDRLNSLLFNVWRDKSAEAYRDGDIARITNEYRNYISQVRSLAEEANRLNRQLDEKSRQIEKLKSEIWSIATTPEIIKCDIWEAKGEEAVYTQDENGHVHVHYRPCGQVRFVAKGLNGRSPQEEQAVAARYLGPCDKINVRLYKNL